MAEFRTILAICSGCDGLIFKKLVSVPPVSANLEFPEIMPLENVSLDTLMDHSVQLSDGHCGILFQGPGAESGLVLHPRPNTVYYAYNLGVPYDVDAHHALEADLAEFRAEYGGADKFDVLMRNTDTMLAVLQESRANVEAKLRLVKSTLRELIEDQFQKEVQQLDSQRGETKNRGLTGKLVGWVLEKSAALWSDFLDSEYNVQKYLQDLIELGRRSNNPYLSRLEALAVRHADCLQPILLEKSILNERQALSVLRSDLEEANHAMTTHRQKALAKAALIYNKPASLTSFSEYVFFGPKLATTDDYRDIEFQTMADKLGVNVYCVEASRNGASIVLDGRKLREYHSETPLSSAALVVIKMGTQLYRPSKATAYRIKNALTNSDNLADLNITWDQLHQDGDDLLGALLLNQLTPKEFGLHVSAAEDMFSSMVHDEPGTISDVQAAVKRLALNAYLHHVGLGNMTSSTVICDLDGCLYRFEDNRLIDRQSEMASQKQDRFNRFALASLLLSYAPLPQLRTTSNSGVHSKNSIAVRPDFTVALSNRSTSRSDVFDTLSTLPSVTIQKGEHVYDAMRVNMHMLLSAAISSLALTSQIMEVDAGNSLSVEVNAFHKQSYCESAKLFVEYQNNLWTLPDYLREAPPVFDVPIEDTLVRIFSNLQARGYRVVFLNTIDATTGRQYGINRNTIGIQVNWHYDIADRDVYQRAFLHEMYHAQLLADGFPRSFLWDYELDGDVTPGGIYASPPQLELTNYFEHALFFGDIRAHGLFPCTLVYRSRETALNQRFDYILKNLGPTNQGAELLEKLHLLIRYALSVSIELDFGPSDLSESDKSVILGRARATMQEALRHTSGTVEFMDDIFTLIRQSLDRIEQYNMSRLPSPTLFTKWIEDFLNGVQRCFEKLADVPSRGDVFKLELQDMRDCGRLTKITIRSNYLVQPNGQIGT